MRKFRTSLLASFFSSMAVLSFKKRGKEETLESAPSSLSDMSLSGGNLSLGDLGGGLGTLSKLSDIGQTPGSMSDSMLTDAVPKSDKKLQEVEANVNDLKSHVESTDLTTRAMKGEMDNIKNDLSQINDSIRTLLNVYEAVSQQYNPFVEGKPSAPAAPVKAEAKTEVTMSLDDVKLEQPVLKAEAPAAKIESIVNEHETLAPFDDDGPLDRIVRPDEEEVLTLTQGESSMRDLAPDITSSIKEPRPALVRPAAPAARAAYREDTYALDQTRKLIDHLMGKICTERTIGNEITDEDIRAFDLWVGEFRRMGGF